MRAHTLNPGSPTSISSHWSVSHRCTFPHVVHPARWSSIFSHWQTCPAIPKGTRKGDRTPFQYILMAASRSCRHALKSCQGGVYGHAPLGHMHFTVLDSGIPACVHCFFPKSTITLGQGFPRFGRVPTSDIMICLRRNLASSPPSSAFPQATDTPLALSHFFYSKNQNHHLLSASTQISTDSFTWL